MKIRGVVMILALAMIINVLHIKDGYWDFEVDGKKYEHVWWEDVDEVVTNIRGEF